MGRRATLVVMRHGESTWTDPSVNRFAGWVDVPLTQRGREQAAHAGTLLKSAGLKPEICFTSLLRRSITTANIALDAANRLWIPVERTWRLNERHYGALQGQTRPAMRRRYGEEQFNLYRRSYDVRPPAIDTDSAYFTGGDARYRADGLDDADPSLITAESLEDVVCRLAPWWRACVEPRLAAGQTVLVVTHGSVVRAIKKTLEDIPAQEISKVNIPTGVPLAYEFETDETDAAPATAPGGAAPAARPRITGPGSFLDPDAARAGILAVESLGQA